jgi:hypothetical protein
MFFLLPLWEKEGVLATLSFSETREVIRFDINILWEDRLAVL